MKNYSVWTTEQLQAEKEDLILDCYNVAPDICGLDKTDNLQMIKRMRENHVELLAVLNELQSRQNRET